MRLAIFSDIHGNQYAFEAFLADIETKSIDKLYFLGDVFGYYYGQNECLTILRDLSSLVCIYGNHDLNFMNYKNGITLDINELQEKYGSSYLDFDAIGQNNYTFMLTWNSSWKEQIDGKMYGFFHGSPDNIFNGRVYPDTQLNNYGVYTNFDVVFLGHTHHKMSRCLGNTHIYNPGSLGQQRDGKGCSYIIYDTVTGEVEWRIIEYNVDMLLEQVKTRDPDNVNLAEVLLRHTKGGGLYGEL